MSFTELGEFGGDTFEYFPIGTRFPDRIHCFGEGMQEGMHIGAAYIVLLIPGGGGQYDIRMQRRGSHPVIDGNHQIQLAFGSLIVPFLVQGKRFVHLLQLFSEHTVLCTQQMLHEILHPFGAAAYKVGTPDKEILRTVFGIVQVFGGQVEFSAMQFACNITWYIHLIGGSLLT